MSQSTGTRRGRFRFLYQFSLRTLLLATAAVAIFCNWYFQPKYHEDELAGKDLRVRQQKKLVQPKAVELPSVPGMNAGPAPQPQPVDHGHYTLLDGDDFVLARGQFADGSQTGRWVTYYPTGHKAAEGKMHSGVKVGLWRTWYEDGTLASEVTYADKPVERFQPFRSRRPFVISVIPVYDGPSKVFDPHIDCHASREGPIKAWYPTGELRYEGQNRADTQEGLWKYYDEQGRLTASGPFRAGKRHGTWTITQARSASEGSVGQASRLPSHSRSEWTTLSVEYLDGRTREALDRLLARLNKKLDSPQAYRRTQALLDLAEIGEGAVPLLQQRLATDDENEQLAILAVLPRMNAAAVPLLPRVRELAKSSDSAVSHQARLTLFQLDAEARGSLFDTLRAEAIAAAKLSDCLQELVILYRSDESHQAEVFAELMSLPLTRSDADSERIVAAVEQLGGDLGPHIAAALESKHERVRVQGAETLLSLFSSAWRGLETYVSFDEPTWNRLLAGLKSDPSPEVRALAEKIEQGPNLNGPFGGGGIF
jgi:antitoxin component YwqK of YwqJK toxin-antitoxin module